MGQWNLMVVASPAAVQLVVWLLPLDPVKLREHQKVTKYLNSSISVVTGNALNVTFSSKFNVIQ
jgi:hypothetical protein